MVLIWASQTMKTRMTMNDTTLLYAPDLLPYFVQCWRGIRRGTAGGRPA
jgi:hypothetical protein